MRLFGLIGYPLSHSFSKKYFTDKFAKENITGATYELFQLKDINAFPQLLSSQPELCGLNVTIPHKVNVIPFLDRVEAAASRIGAVNVIRVLPNGQTIGYNSDYFGFQDSLINWFTQLHGEAGREKLFTLQALILGSGGASKAVRTALDDLGIVNQIVSREAANGLTYDQLDASTVAQYALIINATPLGTSPNTEAFPPFPYHLAGPNHYFYDLVYNPVETVFYAERPGPEGGYAQWIANATPPGREIVGNLEQPANNLSHALPHRKVYFISGLGADQRVFQFLELNRYQGIPISWEWPLPDESLPEYAARLVHQLDQQSKIILIGVSFGGIIAQEIARLVPCEQVIIISSIKSGKELPWTMQLVKYTRLHLLFPAAVLKWLNLLTAGYYFGTESKAENALLRAIIQDTDNHFMQWAIARMMQWKNHSAGESILHIHGTRDRIFPVRPIRNVIPISGGGHFMIVNRAKQISAIINEALQAF